MHTFTFGGSVGDVLDPATNAQVSPRCFGTATIDRPDLEQFAKATIVRVASGTLVQFATGSLLALNNMQFGAALAAATNAELSGMGCSVQITDVRITFSDEDQAAMASAAQQAAPAPPPPQQQQHQHGFAPGTRVLATWSDGRTFPATVRSFNGSMYEIAWVGTEGSSTWVPAHAVRPG